MSHTRPATNNSLVDCHFFVTGRCDRRGDCDFRHNKKSLSTTIVCSKYVVGECKDPDSCDQRHPLICKHDRKSGGCISPCCPFHHLNPCVVDGTRATRSTARIASRTSASILPHGRQDDSAAAVLVVEEDALLHDMVYRMRQLCMRHGMPAGGNGPTVVVDAVTAVAREMRSAYQDFLRRQAPSHQERNDWFDDRWIYIERSIRGGISALNHPPVPVTPGVRSQSHNRHIQPTRPPPVLISRHPVAMGVPVSLVPDQAVRRTRSRNPGPQPQPHPPLPAAGVQVAAAANANATTASAAPAPAKKSPTVFKKKSAKAKPAATAAATPPAPKAEAKTAPASVTPIADQKVKTADLLAGTLENVLNIKVLDDDDESDSEIESFEHDDSYFK